MKGSATLVPILISAALSHAQSGFESKASKVNAYVQFTIGELPPQMVFAAEAMASRIFTEAGVCINWRMGWSKRNREKQPILIDIASDVAETSPRDGLAYAWVFEGVHITIFWDRVKRAASHGTATSLLAHVLVHEITHILQGTEHHSMHGIMKARWTSEDIWQMARKPLGFDRRDLGLIQRGPVIRRAVTDRDRKTDSLIDSGLRTEPDDR